MITMDQTRVPVSTFKFNQKIEEKWEGADWKIKITTI